MIPLFKVAMTDGASVAVDDVLHSGYIGEGEKVRQFTKNCSNLIENPYSLALNSCTAGLQIALELAGVGPGDHVISTPMTCLATNMAILSRGAKIIWSDVDPETGNIDYKDVDRILKSAPEAKAVMCVHWAGYPCDLEELRMLCAAYNVPLIEDAAHAWGSLYRGKPIGSDCDFASFSFQAIKHLTTGDGGLLAMCSPEMFERARLMKWFGLDRELSPDMRCNQDPPLVGLKYHMNDIAAAIGLANFTQSLLNVRKGQQHAAEYSEAFGKLCSVRLPKYLSDRTSSYWLYPLLVDRPDAFMAFLKDSEIACSKVHARNDEKTLFQASKRSLPGADYFDGHQVNIPVGWWLSRADIDNIIDAVRRYDIGNSNSGNQQRAHQEQDSCDLAANHVL